VLAQSVDIPRTMTATGWHITSRNRANHICLRGLRCGTDYDNFGAFARLGPQLMRLHGAKPIFVGVDRLPALDERSYARHLHVGVQQLRALQLDLADVDLHVDLPTLAERYRLNFAGGRILLDSTSELHRLLRKAARSRKGAKSVSLKVLAKPHVRDWCIAKTGSAAVTVDLDRTRVKGVYTLSQAKVISDHETAASRAAG
jgi:hypothetical protein